MEIFFYVSSIILLSYLLFVIYRFGFPKSLSESTYLIGKKGNIAFYSVFIGFIFPLLVYWLEITKDQNHQFLVFLSCAGLLFTGITGSFKGDKGIMSKRIHFIATIIAALLSQIWMWATFHQSWISLVIFIPAYFIGKNISGAERPVVKHPNKIVYSDIIESDSILFWIEMALFFLAYTSIFVYGALC